jgi:protein ImuB
VLHGLLALRLGHLEDPLDVGYGFDFVRLAATAVGPWSAEAVALPQSEAGPRSDIASGSADAQMRLVARLGDRLAARFGPMHVLRVSLGDTHIPEHAARLIKAGPPDPSGAKIRSGPRAELPKQSDGVGPLRPLRLFDPPEPIEVIAEVPDGPPLRLRWRRQSLRIAATEGPERIVTPWWTSARGSPSAPPRDYYRIADETGRRLWVYREGLYQQPPDGPAPRWFVHGLFA